MKKGLLIASLCLVIAVASPSFAGVITIGLNDPLDTNPDPYIVDIVQMPVTDHSAIELYIANIEDPLRYKEWEITVYIPEGYLPLTKLDIVDYEKLNSPPLYLERYDVPMAAVTSIIPGYDAYHASTYEAQWFEYGTQPIGAGGDRVPIGNPAWISYHFYVDDAIPGSTEIFISIHDECIPEPATICLLGLGGLLLRRRNRS